MGHDTMKVKEISGRSTRKMISIHKNRRNEGERKQNIDGKGDKIWERRSTRKMIWREEGT